MPPSWRSSATAFCLTIFGSGRQLSPRERSLITVAALVALNRVEQLPFHLQLAQRNGVTRQQLAELITHLAFYAGWPAAASAVARLRELEQEANHAV